VEFVPNPSEMACIQRIQEHCRSEYAILRITETMHVKSIIDASRPFYRLVKDAGVFDFDGATRGKKYYLETALFRPTGVENLKTSYYRPKAKPGKPGDPRFWVYGLGSKCSVGEMIYFVVFNDQLVAIPLNENCCSLERLTLFFGESDDLEILSGLLELLKPLRGEWVKSCSPLNRNPKDVGATLEAALGISENSRRDADYLGAIELKAKRASSKADDTLFCLAPDWPLGPIPSAREMVLTYGYDSKPKKNRPGFRELYVTVDTRPNSQGLSISVDEDDEELHQYYSGSDGRVLTAVWPYSRIRSRLSEKLPKTVWCLADEAKIDGEIHFKYHTMELTNEPVFSQFMLLIEQDIIRYNWRGAYEIAGKGRRDKGHPFRLRARKYRELLFGSVETIEF
jgi:hypothetical protein